jgi:cell division protein FtsQ
MPRPTPTAPDVAPPDEERTVRIARRRFARRQWTRRWLAWRRLAAGVLALAVVILVAWLFFFSSALAVSGVQVEGASVLDPRAVRQAAAVPTGAPLATVDLGAITARVEELPAVRSADVSRSWPHQVRIAVTERTAVAAVQRAGVWHGLADDGVLFRRYPSRPAGLPVVHMSAGTRSDALAETARVVSALPADLASRVDYVEVRTVDTISLHLRNGRDVLWGSADDSANKAEVLAVLLKQKASFYDVSVPGQPILKR